MIAFFSNNIRLLCPSPTYDIRLPPPVDAPLPMQRNVFYRAGDDASEREVLLPLPGCTYCTVESPSPCLSPPCLHISRTNHRYIVSLLLTPRRLSPSAVVALIPPPPPQTFPTERRKVRTRLGWREAGGGGHRVLRRRGCWARRGGDGLPRRTLRPCSIPRGGGDGRIKETLTSAVSSLDSYSKDSYSSQFLADSTDSRV